MPLLHIKNASSFHSCLFTPLNSVLFHTARMLLEQKRHRISQGSAVVRTVRQRKLKMADRISLPKAEYTTVEPL